MRSVRFVAVVLAFFALSGIVPAQTGSSAKAPAGKSAANSAKPAASSATQSSGDLVDVNHASAAELKALPGIGDAYSLAIVKHRPYKNKTQLRSMGVIPPATYEKIKNRIVAKQ